MKDFYTLQDLKAASLPELDKPARLAVIGHPIIHSRSPQMHQPALDVAGIDTTYIRIDLTTDEFDEGIHRLIELDFIGCNVTVPHKEAAFAIADAHAASAMDLGVCNTLAFRQNEIFGASTDGPGFGQAIREDFGIDVADLKILILGAGGGAGRAIAHHCADESCQQLILINRTLEKAQKLAQQLATKLDDEYHLAGPSDRLIATHFEDPRLGELIGQAELIVNATSLGLKRGDPSPLPRRFIEPHHLVYDTLYHETQLQCDAQQRGARLATGLSMLLHQGALSFQIWLDQRPDLSAMRSGLS